MMVDQPSFQQTRNKAFLIVSLLLLIPAIVLSTMTLIADRYAYLAETMLDDHLTEDRDMMDISEQSIPAYRKAINTLERVRTLAPLNSDHARSLTDLFSSINVWQETMKTMGAMTQEGLPTDEEFRYAVLRNARKAVTLDPANADHYLALGRIYAADGMREAALEQLIKAINSYPVSGAIRYAATMQMLMMGMNEQAREQARLLARYDDSYRLDDDDPASNLMRERRPPGYEARLAGSYLYKAMEIIYRTSEQDPTAVMAIVPDNIDAREISRLFIEQKE
jgi:tetratricopeptide (TPR) repeat protein